MYFKDIIGQEEVKERLRQSTRTGIVPHAQLFTEQGGAGAFPLALAYARYLNCTNRTETDACGRCPSCLKYDELAHPDLHFVFPIVAKKEKKKEVCDDYLSEWRGFLKEHPYFNMDEWLDYIEAGNSQAIIYSKESDEIIHKLSLKIYEAEYRILMVWLPEKLHPTCANKLLKIIEEPPMKTVILMVSETPDLILGTIQSRAQRIHIRPIETDAIMNAMVSRFGLSPDDAKHVAHLSSGSFIKAMEAISLGEENKFFLEQFKAMMRNSWARNVKGMKVIKMELGEPDASGRRSPVEILGSEYEIEADTVIMSLGTSPNPLISSTTKGLETNRRKCIVAEEENGATSKSGVFAGGDAVTGAATVILAMGAGKAAAKGIDAYLNTK